MIKKAGKSAKDNFISQKVSKILKEGVRGKPVAVDQAVAIAHSYAKRNKK